MGYLYITLMVIFTTAGQLLTKKGAGQLVLGGGVAAGIKSLFNPYILIAGLIILITPLFYILALKEMELSTAYAFTGLNYILVSLGGKLVFREQLNKYHYLGMACIFLGLIVFQM